MKTVTILATIVVDETHQNAPSDEDFVLSIENAILTPDNASYGIKDVSVVLQKPHD